ncbi:MAG: hypothetical protein GC192_13865 [Bacteroidetes bacterium]|nr:hypothetical protein [Bacteroidota bacterium]
MTRTAKGRVKLPQWGGGFLNITKKIAAKHTELGANSPLKMLEDYDFDEIAPLADAALVQHDAAEDFAGKAETAYRERDKNKPLINDGTRAAVNLLKAKYAKNPKMLIEWGVEVDDTKMAAPKTPGT